MSLNSDQLDAFFEVARLKSFSRAADVLCVSQPALSQRIRKLEETLKVSLFVREPNAIKLTDMGQRLLIYCRSRRDLEAEFFAPSKPSQLTGVIRIAGFSSIMRSVVMPAVNNLVTNNPHLHIEFLTRELHEMPNILKSAESDFVLTDKPVAGEAVESHHLGIEESVLIESNVRALKIPDVFFDHDSNDQTTFDFFKKQRNRNATKIRRSFLDEIYAIIDAVENGWGRAVVPKHLIANNKRVRHVPNYSSLKTDVYLNYHAQPFYLPLHKAVIAELIAKFGVVLQ